MMRAWSDGGGSINEYTTQNYSDQLFVPTKHFLP